MSSQVFTTTGTQTWTWPTGVTSVTAECLGAGGGSGIASGNPATGGGGKGGSYAKATITKGAESLLTVLVGAPGAVAAAGGFSSIDQGGTTVCLAPGGGGGASQATNSANGAGATTSNGTAVGTTIFAGGNGGTGDFTSGVAGSGAGGGAAGPTGAGGNASINVAGIAGTGLFLDGQKYQGAGAAGVGNSTVGSAAPSGLNNNGGGASGGKANNNTDQGGWSGRQGIVVLTWTDAPTTLQLLTSTGKLRQANLSTALALPMSPAPAVGSGIVLTVCGTWSFPTPTSPMVFGANWVTDNRGNTYKLAVSKQLTGAPNFACAIYYCEKVGTTGSPFTITITPDDGAKHYFVASAREIGGLGTNILKAIQTASNTGTTATTAASGSTPTVNGEALAVAVMGRGLVGVATAITVETIYPNWTQEFEELDGSGYIASEGDLRITTYSGAVSANWTHTATSPWVAAIAAFQSLAPPAPQSVSGVSIASTLIVPGTEQKLLGVNDPTDYSNYWGSNYNAGYMCGQSISGHTGPLTAVAIQLLQLTPDTPAVNLYFTINQGALNGPVLATSSNVLLSSLSTSVPGFVKFNFPSPITMVAGTTYVLQLNRDLYSNATVRVYIGAGTADTYPGGVFYSPVNDPDGFGRDASFRLYTLTCHAVTQAGPNQPVAGNTISSGSVVRPATVVPGPVTVTGVGRATTAQLFAPTVAPPTQAVLGATIGGAYARAVVADGAVGYWRFAGGSLAPTVGPTGTLVSGSVATVPGQFDEALSFNGTVGNAQVVLPHAAALNLTTTGTLEAWIKLPDNNVDVTLFAKGSYGVAWGYGLAIYSNEKLLWRRNAGDYMADDPTLLPRNVWFHLVVTVNNATSDLRAYVNGVLYTGTWSIGAGTTGPFFTATTEPIGVGFARSSTTPSEYLTGIIDELAIYPTVLTATQVAQHAASGVYAPTVSAAGLAQAVSGVTVPSGALLKSPTVTTGPVTVLGVTVASGVVLRAPSVAAGPVTILGAGVVGAASVFVAAVTTGSVTVTGATVGAGSQVFAPVLTPGAVTIGGATRSSATVLFAPSVAAGPVTLLGVRITVTATLSPPVLTNIAVGAVGTAFIPSAMGLHAPVLAGGLATILVPAISGGAASTPPTVSVGPVTILASTCATTVVVRVPSVTTGLVTVLGATCVATSQTFAAAVSAGPVAVGGATILATISSHAPSVSVPVAGTVTGATLGSTASVGVPVVGIVGLWRVNGTGLVKASGPVSSISLTLSPQPVVGNAIVVLMAGQRDSTGMTFGTCTDNQSGHVYSQAFERRITNHGEYAITVYYLPRIKVSNGQFTITITGLGTDHCFEGCAIEVGGVTGDLGLASAMSNTVTNSPTVNSGNTAALNGQHFVVGLCVRYDDGQSITVQAVTPPWTQEYEELMGTWLLSIAGEGDSRVASFSNANTSARWTLDAAAPYVAGVAAFKVGVQAVGGATIPTTTVVRAATVAPAFITVLAARVPSGALLWAPSLVPGPVTVLGSTLTATPVVFAPAVAPGAVTISVPLWQAQALVTEPAVAHESEPVVTFATITNTVQVFAPTNLNMGATDVFVGSVARTAVTYPPSVIRALRGAAITNTSSLHTPRVSLVDDRQLVTVAYIVNDAGTSRVLDVFDLLTIGPWVKTVGIYAPVVWIPPIQTIDVPTLLQVSGVYAPSGITIVPIAAATIASGSRIFIPIIIPGGWEVAGPIPLTSTVVLIPPAVANPDRFSALTGVAITPALGALGVVNLNPITSATGTVAVGTAVAAVAGLPSGVLTATTVATMLPAWAVVPSSAGTPTGVGFPVGRTDAVARGVIAGAVLKPMTVATVVGTSGLDATSGLGVLSCPRVAAVTGLTTPTALATPGSLLTVTASQVPAIGDVGALHAFSGVVAITTGVSATATVAAVSPQLERVLSASAMVSALGGVGLASTIPLASVLTISQLGMVSALVSYTRGLTGVATSGTVGTVTRALSVALTAVPLTVDLGLLVGQSRATATGTTTSVGLARPLPETSRTLLPVTSLGAVGTVLAHAPVIRALMGTSATGALGVLTPTVTQAVSTVLATTARGTVSAATDRAAVAVVSTSAVGSIAKIAIQAVLPAVSDVGTVGALVLSRERVVPGVRSVPMVGALGHSTDLALLTVAATTAVTDVRVAPGLTGVAATGAVGLLSTAITRAALAVSSTGTVGASPLRTDSVLTGVLATSAVGDLTVLHRLAGVTAISATGALVVTVNRTVQSVFGTTGLGLLPQTTAVALGGVAATTALGTMTAGADVTTFLLNVRASCHVGTLSTSRVLDLYLTSAVGTGMLGTAVARPLFAISGVETDSAVGTLAIARQAPGVSAQGRVGLVGHAVTVGLTGAAAQGVVGSVGAALTWQAALLGVSTSVWAGAVVAAPFSALTWVYVIGRTGHVGLTVDGARTLTGVLADIAQADLGIVTRHAVTGSAATGRTGLLAGAGERTIALPSVEALGRTGLVHARLQTAGSGVVTPTASADALGVEWATALLGVRTIVSPGVIGVTGADAPPEILDFTVVVKREEMLTVAVETAIDGWCVVTREAETVVEVEPEPDFLSPVTLQRAPVLHPLTVVAVKPEYLDVTVAVTQSLTIEVMRSGVWDEVRVSRQLDLTASLDSDLDVSVRVLLEETYAVETER